MERQARCSHHKQCTCSTIAGVCQPPWKGDDEEGIDDNNRQTLPSIQGYFSCPIIHLLQFPFLGIAHMVPFLSPPGGGLFEFIKNITSATSA